MRRGRRQLQRRKGRRRPRMLQRYQDERRGRSRTGQRARRQEIIRQAVPPERHMSVGLLTLELHIPDAQSLKDKRQILRSLKDRLRGGFNGGGAGLGSTAVWQK